MIAFSPHVRHALNFAIKHHDGQFRRNRKAPYIMHPMQVALILARYGRPDQELIAGLLHDVLEDCVEDNAGLAEMEAKMLTKFGPEVLAIVQGVTEAKRDARDHKLGHEVRRAMYLKGLETAPAGSLWVCAADKVQNGMEVLVDLLHSDDREAIWGGFSGGKEEVVSWYRRVHSKLVALGFEGDIMHELNHTATMLECASAPPLAV